MVYETLNELVTVGLLKRTQSMENISVRVMERSALFSVFLPYKEGRNF